MLVNFTGTYLLYSAVTIPGPLIPTGWKLKPLYVKLCRGEGLATLELVQDETPYDRGDRVLRYNLSGTLKAWGTKFILKGTARANEPIGTLVDPSEFGTRTVTGSISLRDKGHYLETKVCLEQDYPFTLTELLLCNFSVVSRSPGRDSRLVGQWQWSDFHSSGGFSASVHRFWVFGANGRVIESAQSFASSQLKGQDGSWQGLTTAESRVPAGNRGTWEADGQILKINWDDCNVSNYQYEIDQGGMLVQGSGSQQYWEKI